jgi:hypothetical protein
MTGASANPSSIVSVRCDDRCVDVSWMANAQGSLDSRSNDPILTSATSAMRRRAPAGWLTTPPTPRDDAERY